MDYAKSNSVGSKPENTRSLPVDVPKSPARFVAYVYPGWHEDPYRPGINEWDLLTEFNPYFASHRRPPRPLHGAYDDSKPSIAMNQLSLAVDSGVSAFLYFTYYGSQGFVMSSPMQVAFDFVEDISQSFGIAGTWCVRLPHNSFPVPARDEIESPQPVISNSCSELKDKPIELLTLDDLEQLLGPGDPIWNSQIFTERPTQVSDWKRRSRAAK